LIKCSKPRSAKRSYRFSSRWILAVALVLVGQAHAQNRGLYPLGMSATNSGITPEPGFSYANQLLYYSRDESKDDHGNKLPVSGLNYVLMDMNSLIWVSEKKILGGAHYSAIATLPFAKNDLTSDIHGNISGGGGFADSYYIPVVLGWNRERVGARAMYGFLAPTGRFAPGASNNVGSGYWTHTLSSGQTFYLTTNKSLIASAFEMYEFHTVQEGTGIHPGETFDLDYSLMAAVPRSNRRFQIGVVGYEARQTTAKTDPQATAPLDERYAINAVGFAFAGAFPKQRASLTFKYFKELENRATFEGYSAQVLFSIHF